jgi:D-cysteine desulfhydrase family pyridoxal phosphate-dependent enzyme
MTKRSDGRGSERESTTPEAQEGSGAVVGRRSFLRLAGLGGSVLAIDACGGQTTLYRPSPVVSDQPRVELADLPTPLQAVPRLSDQLGPELWMKRDDQTGLATGGNKARKLEFLVGEAVALEADTLVTQGSSQSNHCRQTAAAAARMGLGCLLSVRGSEPSTPAEANLLLDQLLGAQIRFENPPLEDLGSELVADGRRPYLIPTGGSNSVGVMGYVAAMDELADQMRSSGARFDTMVLATGSGGTQAGLAVGARSVGWSGRIVGISVSRPGPAARDAIADLSNVTSERLGLPADYGSDDFEVHDEFLGGGYGVMSDLEASAIRTVASTEGILLDPVYTGRAFGGLMRLIESGEIGRDERILFWHTGGTPALLSSRYAEDLT